MSAGELDRAARGRLRPLSKDNADRVARHLVMAGRLVDTDPEAAYQHALAAVRTAGRIDVVREAAGVTAYRAGRYADALRELRTARRLNGSSEHLALMADCERGLGRPERAIDLAASPEARTLDLPSRIELAIVVSGARCELGEYEAAAAALEALGSLDGQLGLRVLEARASILEARGDSEGAARLLADIDPERLRAAAGEAPDDEDEVVVYDLAENADYPDDLDQDPTATEQRGAERPVEPTNENAERAAKGLATDEPEEPPAHSSAPPAHRGKES